MPSSHPSAAASQASQRPAIPVVVQQHAEESVVLRNIRAVHLRSPHVQLHRLRRLDDRIAAHLDGLAVAGAAGLALLEEGLASPSAGSVFALGVCALQSRDAAVLTRLVSLAAALPEAERGLLSALGWVSAEDLQGTVRALLGSRVGLHRAWGLAACAMHRVDPGAMLAQAVADPEPAVRARAWRVAGQAGRRDLAEAAHHCLLGTSPAEAAVRRAAAWALTLWGMGQSDAVRLALMAAEPGQKLPCPDAQRLAIIAAPLVWARDEVRALSAQAETSPPHKRRMMRLAGWVGDPQVVPWLIHHMAEDVWARLAGEAFSLITGADLALLDLERKPPEDIDTGPNADPEDENVALDEDDSLPWPDQRKVQNWWQVHSTRFVSGRRYFEGEPPGAAHAVHVLKTAGQRQRVLAAEHLCLSQPGSTLFQVAAPAWRQQRWLSAMSPAGVDASSRDGA
jgi:uncharacterized protein (TIGR02270 family)